MASDPWGIADGFWGTDGAWWPTEPDTAQALRDAMGADPSRGVDDGEPLWIVREGAAEPLLGPCELTLGDGSELGVLERLPPELPLGDHRLAPCDGGPVTHLVVAPARCHLPAGLRSWGWSAQLYATRSAASWGHGDLGDLRVLGAMAAEQGAGFVALNPLHDGRRLPRCEPSPYYPSSRVWLNPLYLRLEDVAGFSAATGELAELLGSLASRGRALNDERLLDRDRVWPLKLAALEALWAAAPPCDGAFERWRAAQGASLQDHAVFCALAEHHRRPWRSWPEGHRHPARPEVARFAVEAAPRVAFHAWLQWLLQRQLDAAGRAVPILADLAVGFDPDGSDAWRWQSLLALDARIGAPPDEFNPAGQDWGLPPFVPAALRAAHYAPWREALEAACRHGGGLRIDHVMGLFRLYWIPPDGGSGRGAYVRFAGSELLDFVALASAQTGTAVVGEDLGTVEDEVRSQLRERDVLSTRLVWFEEQPPAGYPVRSLASLSTHDLPTLAGLVSGADAEDRAVAGVAVDPTDDATLRARLDAVAPSASVEELAAVLGDSPAMLVMLSLEDALGVTERPNLPGTTSDQRPNWRRALPVPLEELRTAGEVEMVAATLRRSRPPQHGGGLDGHDSEDGAPPSA